MTCPGPNLWTVVLAFMGAFHMLFEYWLGKTDKVDASSTIELLLNFFKRR